MKFITMLAIALLMLVAVPVFAATGDTVANDGATLVTIDTADVVVQEMLQPSEMCQNVIQPQEADTMEGQMLLVTGVTEEVEHKLMPGLNVLQTFSTIYCPKMHGTSLPATDSGVMHWKSLPCSLL